MKRLVLFILMMGLLTAAFPKAQTSAVDPEVDAIRAVADVYISADPARLRDAFLPSMNLYTTDEKEGLRTIPFAEYLQRVSANANAAREERQTSIDLVDRAGNVAIVKVTTIRPHGKVTDYLSLVRIEKQWKVVNKAFFVEPRNPSASAPQAQTQTMATDKPCSGLDHHRFDFMIGTWHTIDPGNTTVAAAEGESTVEPMLDGCIVHEHRSLTRQGKRLFDGDAYWGFDSTTKHWLLFYMDDQLHAQVYEGREEAGHLAFYRERLDPDGKLILIRVVYAPASTSSYTQAVERSSDHGATWQPGGVTTYQSKR
jgi:putative lumazine-binding protein